MAEIVLSVEDVSYSYASMDEEDVRALKNVSFDVERGSFVAIIGHNGSGKSTLAKLLNGLFLPKEGKVLVLGMDTQDEDLTWQIRQNAGLVFQNPDNQLVTTIVEEDVAFGPENLGIEPEEIRRRVDSALQTVGMKDFARHAPHKLSGGQKQRIAIAGILAMKPECILFDESTAMLDPQGRRDIMDTILHLNREEKITVVLITHHMDEAVMADRVIVMDGGKVVKDGVPGEIFSDVPFLHGLGLDAPQTTEFLHLVSETPVFSDVKFPKGVLDIESAAEFILSLFGKE